MDFDKRNARFLSMLGHRGAFSVALTELGAEIDNLVVVTADMTTLTGLDRFKTAFPDKLINVGIAEQNLVGVAAGIAKDDNVVFATTYANFITMRSYEQVRVNLGYMGFNVKIVGSSGGLSMGVLGNTHYAMEDIALMRAIPGMVVLSPADGIEVVKATRAAAEYRGPVYIRLSGVINQPSVYTEDYDFQIGKAVELKEGKDITIFSTGTMVYTSLLVAKELEQQGIDAAVYDIHTIKPLDMDAVKKAVEGSRLLVTIEEHSTIGGLGSAVAEAKADMIAAPPQIMIGIPDRFCKAGDYPYLLEQNGLMKDAIIARICKKYKEL